MNVKQIIKEALHHVRSARTNRRYEKIYDKYKFYTMNPQKYYLYNLELAERFSNIPGDIVECGTWRGGMIAGMAEIIGNKKKYYLYDSFEGLPQAKAIDGQSAIDWQKDTSSVNYFDNCMAEISYAQTAMKMADVEFLCIKGWFDNTIPISKHEQIGILRLDGDWYDSTMVCLEHLFPKVVSGGLIILDDYHFWDGCCKATHDYLSKIQSDCRIYTGKVDVAYIIKK